MRNYEFDMPVIFEEPYRSQLIALSKRIDDDFCAEYCNDACIIEGCDRVRSDMYRNPITRWIVTPIYALMRRRNQCR